MPVNRKRNRVGGSYLHLDSLKKIRLFGVETALDKYKQVESVKHQITGKKNVR